MDLIDKQDLQYLKRRLYDLSIKVGVLCGIKATDELMVIQDELKSLKQRINLKLYDIDLIQQEFQSIKDELKYFEI